jgi:hypothetical protein
MSLPDNNIPCLLYEKFISLFSKYYKIDWYYDLRFSLLA